MHRQSSEAALKGLFQPRSVHLFTCRKHITFLLKKKNHVSANVIDSGNYRHTKKKHRNCIMIVLLKLLLYRETKNCQKTSNHPDSIEGAAD